jgi:hypothetical protein
MRWCCTSGRNPTWSQLPVRWSCRGRALDSGRWRDCSRSCCRPTRCVACARWAPSNMNSPPVRPAAPIVSPWSRRAAATTSGSKCGATVACARLRLPRPRSRRRRSPKPRATPRRRCPRLNLPRVRRTTSPAPRCHPRPLRRRRRPPPVPSRRARRRSWKSCRSPCRPSRRLPTPCRRQKRSPRRSASSTPGPPNTCRPSTSSARWPRPCHRSNSARLRLSPRQHRSRPHCRPARFRPWRRCRQHQSRRHPGQ